MRVLVTGASGFLGGTVTRSLSSAGHDVTGLYRSDTRFLRTVAGTTGASLVRGDLAEAKSLPGRFDAVVHAAATSPAPGIDTERLVTDNVLGTARLIDAAKRWGCRAFVLCSSLSVYGAISRPVVDEETPIVDPDAYGASKHLCELMLADRADSLPGLALRLPGVLGPGAHRNWLSGIAARLLAGEPVRAYHLERPFNNGVHVSDLSAFVTHVLSTPWKQFDAVVMGARGGIPVRAAIERLAAGLGVEARIVEAPSAKASFTLCSERAMTRWGYDPMEIGTLIDRYAADVLSWHERGSVTQSKP